MPKPLNEQVIVITGASSGIGRATALLLARKGASVVLAARNDEALLQVQSEMELFGGKSHTFNTDVADWSQVQRLADEAVSQFGRIDTWINDASVATYGTIEETPIEDIEKVVQINLMGVIHGCKAALPHLAAQGSGQIINIGSAVSRRSAPLLGVYATTKHGVKGFTDALRMELERDHPGIDVTLILPASINTPFFEHARSNMGVQPRPLPPVYEPEVAAEAIVASVERPQRDVYIGSAAKTLATLEAVSPAFADRLMLAFNSAFKAQKTTRPDDGVDNLDGPVPGSGSVTGEWGTEARGFSVYTRAFETQNPTVKRLMTLGLGLGAATLLLRATKGGNDGEDRVISYERHGASGTQGSQPSYPEAPDYQRTVDNWSALTARDGGAVSVDVIAD